MATLWELTEDFKQLMELMEDPDIEPQVIKDTLEAVMGELEAKADSYAIVIAQLRAKSDMIDREMDRLGRHKCAIDSNIARMKNALMDSMRAVGKKEIVGELHKLKIQNNGGKKPLEVFGDVPEDFIKLVPENDNVKIRQALENGQELDFARLGNRGQHLRID